MLSILQTFCNAREKMFANSLPFVAWEVYFSVFSSRISWTKWMCFGGSPALAVEIFGNVILLDQSHASKNIWWIQRRNNGIMLSMILWIIRTEVWIICRSRRLMLITQTRGLIIYDIIRKPNSVSVSSYIF